jgi:hypothetical protein
MVPAMNPIWPPGMKRDLPKMSATMDHWPNSLVDDTED